MFINPYETIPCMHYVMQPTVKALREARLTAEDQIVSVPSPVDGKSMPGIRGLIHGDLSIKPFAHPLPYSRPSRERPGYAETEDIFIDLRTCTRPNTPGQGFTVSPSGHIEYTVWVWRALLMHKLYRSDTPGSDMLGLGIWPMTIYMRWISQALTRRLALPPETQMRLSILTGYFYFCMGVDLPGSSTEPMGERELMRAATLISRAGNFSVNDIVSVIQDIPRANNVEDFVAILVNHTQSLRFEADRFNLAVFYAALEGSWIRGQSSEVVRVSVEHLPTWAALILVATQERGVNKTVIGDITQLAMRGLGDEAKHYIARLHDMGKDAW